MYCNILIDGKWPCTHCTVSSIRPQPCKNPFFIISRQCDRGNMSPLPRPLNGQISTGTRWCDRHHYILINPFYSQQHSNYNLLYDTACCERGDRREGNRTARRGTNQEKKKKGRRRKEGRGCKTQRERRRGCGASAAMRRGNLGLIETERQRENIATRWLITDMSSAGWHCKSIVKAFIGCLEECEVHTRSPFPAAAVNQSR